MNPADIVVVAGGLALTGLLAWFFFGPKKAHSAYAQTTVDLLPDRSGEFGFACGMNMIHGKLVVEPHANGNGTAPPVGVTKSLPAELYADKPDRLTEDNEMAERKAEITDLTRRVVLGAVLTLPVLFSVMAGNFLPVGTLANHWLQLALITPVMFYSG